LPPRLAFLFALLGGGWLLAKAGDAAAEKIAPVALKVQAAVDSVADAPARAERTRQELVTRRAVARLRQTSQAMRAKYGL
jgi:hypothetical protein